jgi:acyl dehydratase
MNAKTTEPTIRFDVAPQRYEGSMTAAQALSYAHATLDPVTVTDLDHQLPPMASTSLIFTAANEALRVTVDAGAVVGAHGDEVPGVHAEHDMLVHRLLAPEEVVSWEATMRSARQTPAGVLLSVQVLIRDSHGAIVIEHLWSTMMLKATTTHLHGPALPDHRFPDEARDHMLGAERLALARDLGRRYGDASGDEAGHAVSDEIARSEGYPSMILQGMCSLAICSGAALRIAGGGDQSRLRRVAGRLSAPMVLGRDLTVSCFELPTEATDRRSVVFEAHQGETLCVAHGRVELARSS